LGRFKDLKPPKEFVKNEVAQIINNLLNISVDTREIEERGGIIYIKTKNSALRNEIFLRKEKILKILKERVGAKAPKDLRF